MPKHIYNYTGPPIIGIAGPKRSGKSTVGKQLVWSIANAALIGFADEFKRILATSFDISLSALNGSEAEKENPAGTIFGKSGRKIMQLTGTEWGRSIHPEIWIHALCVYVEKHFEQCSYVIIPDVRFENEVEFIRKHGVLIHIMGRSFFSGEHASEKGVTQNPSKDIFINNWGTLEELERTIKTLTPSIKLHATSRRTP